MITASVYWRNQHQNFTNNRYSRAHTWTFDGGLEVAASSAPDIVPEPMSDATAVDPEEAFVAALSSCHMLWFLSIAAKSGLEVNEYRDEACGEMQTNHAGKMLIGLVILRPRVIWAIGSEPTNDLICQLHHQAHQECFLANSVKTEIRIEC